MKTKTEKSGWIFIVLTAFFFGTMEVASKLAGTHFNAIQLTFIRFLIGGLILLPFAIRDIRKRKLHFSLSDILYLLLLGVLCVCISMAMLQIGVASINANLASIIISMNPVFTMFFAQFTVHEKFTGRKALVLVISLIGMLIVVNPMSLTGKNNSIFGLIIVFLAAVSFGLYTAIGKIRLARLGGMVQNSFSFLLGSGVLSIFMLISGISFTDNISLQTLPELLYLGIFVTGAGYYCFLKAIEISGPSNASLAFFIKPVLAPLISLVVLHEKLTVNIVVGIIVILIGSMINLLPAGKKVNADVAAQG